MKRSYLNGEEGNAYVNLILKMSSDVSEVLVIVLFIVRDLLFMKTVYLSALKGYSKKK